MDDYLIIDIIHQGKTKDKINPTMIEIFNDLGSCSVNMKTICCLIKQDNKMFSKLEPIEQIKYIIKYFKDNGNKFAKESIQLLSITKRGLKYVDSHWKYEEIKHIIT